MYRVQCIGKKPIREGGRGYSRVVHQGVEHAHTGGHDNVKKKKNRGDAPIVIGFRVNVHLYEDNTVCYSNINAAADAAATFVSAGGVCSRCGVSGPLGSVTDVHGERRRFPCGTASSEAPQHHPKE